MILSAHIGLSYKCNMRCKHCFVQKKQDDSVFILHYKRILDELYKQGLLFLHYTYGEPTVNNTLFEVASYAKDKGIYQTLMSNGYYIQDNDIIKKFNECGISKVYISLDSHIKSVHDENRGVNGSWEKALNAIRLLKNNDIKTGIACTINNNNIMSMDEILKIANNEKVNFVSFLRQRYNQSIIEMSNEKIYFEMAKKIIINDDENKLKVFFHDIRLLPIVEELYKNNKISCHIYEKFIDMNKCNCSHNICIQPNGDISRCNLANHVVGNIKNTSIENVIKEDIQVLCK